MATGDTKMATGLRDLAHPGRIRVVVRARPSAEFADHLIDFPADGKVIRSSMLHFNSSIVFTRMDLLKFVYSQ